jgi:hypothetical protein
MEHAFLDVAPEELARRVHEAAGAAAGTDVVVRVGAEVWGYRNVGVDLPELAGRSLRAGTSGCMLRMHSRPSASPSGHPRTRPESVATSKARCGYERWSFRDRSMPRASRNR